MGLVYGVHYLQVPAISRISLPEQIGAEQVLLSAFTLSYGGQNEHLPS